MKSVQNIVGDSTENYTANFLRENGYWAYILPKKVGGQPFDIIACRCDDIWFLDAKHLEKEKASFSFERIEPNQKTSMSYAQNFAHITNMGFVIYWERTPETLYFLPYERVRKMEADGQKSVKIEELNEFKVVLEYASDSIE
nr:MAG TPA: recombination protein [Caudoviricetes sp.]